MALACGKGKPNRKKIFGRHFSWIFWLNKNALELRDERFRFDIKYFSCDASHPKQFLKCIKGHTCYFACGRSLVEGESIRVIFDDIEASLIHVSVKTISISWVYFQVTACIVLVYLCLITFT